MQTRGGTCPEVSTVNLLTVLPERACDCTTNPEATACPVPIACLSWQRTPRGPQTRETVQMPKNAYAKRLPKVKDFEWLRGVSLKAQLGLNRCPVIRGSSDIAQIFGNIAVLDREIMVSGALDCKCRLIGWSVVALGTNSRMLVRIGDVFNAAIRHGANSIFLAHNHPSGSPKASKDDLDLTMDVAEAGLILGYPLFDHVIISQTGFRSLMSPRILKLKSARFKVTKASVRQASEWGSTSVEWQCRACMHSNLLITTSVNRISATQNSCRLARCRNCCQTYWLRAQ